MLLRTFIPLFCFLKAVTGGCHSCQSNYAACHDETHFSMCIEGTSKDEIRTCPDGYVCTDDTRICVKSTADNPVQPTCQADCDQCSSPGKLFACLDETSYAFCFGQDIPNYGAGSTGSCPSGYVCSLGSIEVCRPATEVDASCKKRISNDPTIPPTTTTPVTTSTASTLAPTQTADEFCTSKQEVGLFKYQGDSTCKKYILCYTLSDQYLGSVYTCSADEFYSDETKECGSEKPLSC